MPPTLDPAWQQPVAAMKDDSLEERVEKALEDVLVEHDLLDRVTRHVEAVHKNKLAQPLTIALLRRYHNKGLNKKERDSRGVEFLGFEPRDAHQTAGITFTLKQMQQGYLSRVAMLFEQHSNFLSFGMERNLIARGCKFHLYQEHPIPLDLDNESYGAEAMLNNLAFLMVSTVQRDKRTGQVKLPVRYGMIISTSYVLLAENVQEVGILYSPIFETSSHSHSRVPYPFWFERRSITLMFLAFILNHLTKAMAPSHAVIQRLFGNTPPDETRTSPPRSAQPSAVHIQTNPIAAKKKRARQCDASRLLPPLECFDVWCMEHEVLRVRLNATVSPASLEFRLPRLGLSTNVHMSLKSSISLDAVTFEVTSLSESPRSLPRYRPTPALGALPPALLAYLSSHLDPEDDFSGALPFLDAPRFLARGGFGAVHAARLRTTTSIAAGEDSGWWSVPRPPANAAGHLRAKGDLISMPTDLPMIIKVFDDQIESGIRENLFYEHEQRIVLALGYGGRLLEVVDMTKELEQDARTAYQLFYQRGINHGDCEARNILLHDDGSLCLIDWGSATLNFSRKPQ
ncbi:BQ2448_1826 [Microbotryum intermedium]|uniref:BQ2448_1826 protein n=1 Tax=Microbotryum intermedium TaxID=269621 RepID=A0A238F985_9BASI|nr:BQ2448_1826 [Microbotryum intermedium]